METSVALLQVVDIIAPRTGIVDSPMKENLLPGHRKFYL